MSKTIITMSCRLSWTRRLLCQPFQRTCATSTAKVISESNGGPETAESWAAAKPYTHLPGPRPYPIVGNVFRLIPGGDLSSSNVMEMQRKLFERFGPIVRLSGLPGRGDMVFLFDPEDICKVLRNDGPMPIRDSVACINYYRKIVRPQCYEGVGGAFAAQGEEWYNFRTKVHKLMLQPNSVRRYAGTLDEVAEDFMERIHELRDEKKELPANFNNELFKWSLESMLAIALDIRMGCLDGPKDSEAQRIIDASQRVFGKLADFQKMPFLWRMGNLSPTWREFVRDLDLMTETAQKYVRQMSEKLEAEKETEESSDTNKDADREASVLVRLLRTEGPVVAAVLAADILTGGSETTATTLLSLLANLAKFPREQSALAEELRRELPGARPRVSTDALDRLPRVRAFLKESMRFSPAVPALPRTTSRNMVLSGYQIPRGTDVIGANLLISRQERHVPRADEFVPERWLKGHELNGKGHPFASLPFGFGLRKCIGMRIAEMKLHTLLVKIVHRYKVEYHYGEMPFHGSFLYSPSGPFKFRLIERD